MGGVYERRLNVSVFFQGVEGASYPVIKLIADKMPENDNSSELIHGEMFESGDFNIGSQVLLPLMEAAEELVNSQGGGLRRLHTTLDRMCANGFVHYAGS